MRGLRTALLSLLVVGATAAPAVTWAASPPAASPPAPGEWTVAGVRVEPAGPEQELDVAGLGSYHGSLVLQGGSGGISVVNQVTFDDYLRGIAEVPSDWPPAALQAQAIAARTYALHTLAIGQTLCATDACQVYAGIAKERADTGGWSAAVAATSGQVLLYKGHPALTMYSSSNGGQMVAGSQPYLRAGPDPDDAASPVHVWHSSVGLDVLKALFGAAGPVTDVARTDHDTVALTWAGETSPDSSTTLTSAPDTSTTASTTTTSEPATTSSTSSSTTIPTTDTTTPAGAGGGSGGDAAPQLGPSTTSTTSRATTTSSTSPAQTSDGGAAGGGRVEVGTSDFVSRLNASQPAPDGLPLLIPSPRFTVRVDAATSAAVFDGKGFGHGIGMSQFGALGKARRGLKAADILAAYYGGLKPVAAPAGMIPAEVPVTLDDSRAETVVTAPGRFRLVADDGTVLTPLAHGSWRFSSTGDGRIRVVPPDDQRGPLTVTPIGSRFTGDPVTGGVAEIHVQLSLPASVKAAVLQTPPEVVLPSGINPAVATAPQDAPPVATADVPPAEPGEAVVNVPFSPGTLPTWKVRVDADAGGGRVGSTELVLDTRFSSVPIPTDRRRFGGSGTAGNPALAATSSRQLGAIISLLALAWVGLSRPFRRPDAANRGPRLP